MAANGAGGLFRDTETKSFIPHDILKGEAESGLFTLFVRRRIPHVAQVQRELQWDMKALGHWPLHTRAWVYQERVLAPRIVSFDNVEVTWECLSTSGCECANIESDSKFWRTIMLDHLELRNLSYEWRTMVAEYSRLNLAYASDRLVALSCCAKYMQKHGDLGRYLAGTWENDFIGQLAWTTLGE
jgi:hypothetical protein